MKQSSGYLILILCMALVIRLAWLMIAPATLDQLPDQREYLMLGQNLLHWGSLNFFDPRFNQTVWAYRMPGYPLLIAACGGSVRVVRFVQCAIDLSTLGAVFLIARRLTANSSVAWVATALVAVNPFYIYFSSAILTETLFAAALSWMVWFLISGRWLSALLFNVTLCYVRPSGLMLMPFLIIAAGLNSTRLRAYPLLPTMRRLVGAGIFLSVCLWPWANRNHRLLGVYLWTTTNSGITAFDGFHDGATGGSDQRFITAFPQLMSINEVDRSRFFKREAVRWITKNLARLPALMTQKIARGWSPIPLSQEFGKPLYQIGSALYAIPFDLLCLTGLFSSRLTRGGKLLLIIPAVYFTLVQVMSVGSIRYRMPAEAPLAVLAATGTVDLLGRVNKEQPE